MMEELVLTPTNITVGIGQVVYSTQYRSITMTKCSKCNEMVGTQSMWRDKDNSMNHLDCLSRTRIMELEMM